MQDMLHGTIIKQGNGNCFASAYTDDHSELWHFSYSPREGHIKATAEKISITGGVKIREKKFSGLPLCIEPEKVTDEFLKISGDEHIDTKHFKEGLKQFQEIFRDQIKLEKQDLNEETKWEIKIARYFGYSETTLALLKSPDGQHFLVRSAGYPYGSPSYDRSVLNWKYMHPTKGRLHWNDYLNDISQGKNDPETMARELKALSFIPCITASPMEEFEDRAEDERFMTREDISQEHFENNQYQPSLLRRFARAALGKRRSLTLEEFNRVDVNREKWYAAERLPKQFQDTFLSKEEAMDLIKQVCDDFGVPIVKKVKFCYPPKPSFWKRKRKPSRVDGLYCPETREISLRYHKDEDGFSKHTVLHELAHHLDNLFVHGGESPSAAHGMRFKKIHMHLMHHYDDVPVEDLLNSGSIKMAYGIPFPLTEQDITGRDFTERRTIDILPVPPKTEEQNAIRQHYEFFLSEFRLAAIKNRFPVPFMEYKTEPRPRETLYHKTLKLF